MKDVSVLVVGAGIGGLQASLALANNGYKVTVLESAQAFEEVCRAEKWMALIASIRRCQESEF